MTLPTPTRRISRAELIDQVHVVLLKLRDEPGQSNETLAARIKHPSGLRYEASAVKRFLADPHAYGSPAFIEACARGFPEICQHLIAYLDGLH